MKKALLGSTALLVSVAMFAGPAAAEFETTLSGFLKAEFWTADQDVDDPREYVFGVDDSEFHIKAKNTADNGLTYGVTFEFEVTDSIDSDEAYLWFEGEWGTIQLGGNDGMTETMPYSGDFSLTAAFGYDGGLQAVWNRQNDIFSPDLAADTGDAAKINYYSPRFNGFQLGLTYLPDSGQATAGSDSLDSDSAVKAVTQVDAAGKAIAGPSFISIAGSDNQDEDIFQVGLNFVDTINGFDIGVGGAYSTSSPESGSSAGREDTEGVHVGFNIGTQGFSFGASYGDNFDSGCDTADGSGCDGGQFYDVAGAYSTGPVTVSVGYFHSERDNTSTTDEDTDIVSIGAKYALAPGAVVITEFNFVDEGGSENTNNDGTTFMVGTQISF